MSKRVARSVPGLLASHARRGSAALEDLSSAAAAASSAAPPAPSHTGKRRRAAVQLAYEEPGAGASASAALPLPSSPARASAALPLPSSPARASAASAPVEASPTSPARGWGTPAAPHPGWRTHLAAIQAARAPGGCAYPAVVDTMGCERCADPSAPPPVQRFQTLVSLMLSSQTKDEVTFAACQRLKDGLHATGGFTAAGVASADLALLEKLIYPVGFYRNKSKFVQAAGRDIVAGGGDIPRSVEGLCKLKGVGPKMAFIAMTAAWGKNVGIGVDTHVHRISNRLQWVKTDSPQQTQAHLQAFLPREEWDALNVLLVGFGQAVCTPLNPRCGECSLAALCPVAAGKKASLAACAASEE